MSDKESQTGKISERPASAHDLLLRLDLAVEVLEGLDELGLETRDEVAALVERLERQIADSR